MIQNPCRKRASAVSAFAAPLLLVSAGTGVIGPPIAVAQEKPKLWAAISVNQPIFLATEETGPGLFQIQFTVVNDGDQTIDTDVYSTKLLVNGKELKDWGLIIGNGPKSDDFKALVPGKYIRFGYAMGRYFNEPGIYRVVWRGPQYASPEIVFRVMAKRN